MTTVLILNGPNLNLLGTREPEIYGTQTLQDVQSACETQSAQYAWSLQWFQSQAEHVLIEHIHGACADYPQTAGVIINPGAYAHSSIAIADALRAYRGLRYEVHISNVYQRETYRHHSYLSAAVDGVITGCGVLGYVLAMQAVHARLQHQS